MVGDASPDVRRLHPATILIGALPRGPSLIFGIAPLYAAVSSGGLLLLAGILALVLVAAAGLGWLKWRMFTYRIADRDVVIADGLIRKSRRSIPFDRIQDVSIEQKPLARLFGLAHVRIETGGGAADEASLNSVSLAEAHRLRAVLRDGAAAVDEPGDGIRPAYRDAPDRDVVFAMSVGRVLTMGVFAFSLVWVGVLFAALNQLSDLIGFDWREVRDIAGVAQHQAAALVTPVFAALALVVALLLGAVSGVVRTMLVEYGFRVERDGDRLRRTRGLATRTEVVVALRRVQLALIERGLLSGRLGWSGLKLQTLGGSDDVGGRQSIAPFARDAEVDGLLAVAGYPPFDPLPLRPVAFGHVVRASVLRGGLPLIAVCVGAFFLPLIAVALFLVPVPVVLALMARRRHRYAILGDTVQVMRGVLRKEAWIVPLANIQAVSITRSPLQRLLGIATVRIGTAGARGVARPNVVDLAVEDAEALAAALLHGG